MDHTNIGTVTELQKTKKGRYSVFLDGEFLFSLDGETLLKNEIRVGKQFDPDKLQQIYTESQLYRAREKALDLLSYRPLSGGELKNKLRKSFEEEICVQVVNSLRETGLVQDSEYAIKLACELYEYRHMSVSFIKQELYKRGIRGEICDQVFSLCDFDDGASIAALLQTKYAAKLKQDPKKVIAALQRKGFAYRDIANKIQLGEYDEY